MDRTTLLVAQLLLLVLGLITIFTALPASAHSSPSCQQGQFIQCKFSSAKNSFYAKAWAWSRVFTVNPHTRLCTQASTIETTLSVVEDLVRAMLSFSLTLPKRRSILCVVCNSVPNQPHFWRPFLSLFLSLSLLEHCPGQKVANSKHAWRIESNFGKTQSLLSSTKDVMKKETRNASTRFAMKRELKAPS